MPRNTLLGSDWTKVNPPRTQDAIQKISNGSVSPEKSCCSATKESADNSFPIPAPINQVHHCIKHIMSEVSPIGTVENGADPMEKQEIF